MGIVAGVLLGLVVLVEMPFVVHPAQLLLDYPLVRDAFHLGRHLFRILCMGRLESGSILCRLQRRVSLA